MLLVPQLALPADAPSLADAVVRAVQDGVAAGALEPGVTYSVYQLADALGISRSPVREALLRLAEAGLVRISKNRGFTVLVPRAQDVEEIVEIRTALEVPAARKAAEHASDEQHAEVRAAWEAMRTAPREADFWAADRALHDVLLRVAGNGRAAEIVARLRATTALLGPADHRVGPHLRRGPRRARAGRHRRPRARRRGGRRRDAGAPRAHRPAAGPRLQPALTSRAISTCRTRNARSSIFLRRSHVVTSVLHLLALHEPHAGTTFSTV